MNVDCCFDIEINPAMNSSELSQLLSLTHNHLAPVGNVVNDRRVWRVNIDHRLINGIKVSLEQKGYTPDILSVCTPTREIADEVTGEVLGRFNLHPDFAYNQAKYESYFLPYEIQVDGETVQYTPPQNCTAGYEPPIWE